MLEWCKRLDMGYRSPFVIQEVRELIRLLHSSDFLTRYLAVEVLGRLGEDARPAIPALVGVLGDWESCAGLAASRVLASLGPASVSYLVEALKHNDMVVRQLAAAALGRMGSRGSSALPALKRALQVEKNDAVRTRLTWAVGKISGQ
jgi:HEAT repeat protein